MQEVRRILKHVIKELKLPVDVQDHVDEYGQELILNGAVGIRKEEGVYCVFNIPSNDIFMKGPQVWEVVHYSLLRWLSHVTSCCETKYRTSDPQWGNTY